jgi:hypothetical protein
VETKKPCVSHGRPEVSVDKGWLGAAALGLHAAIDLRGLAVARGSDLAAPGPGTTHPGSMWPSPSARYRLPPLASCFPSSHHELSPVTASNRTMATAKS